MLVAILNIWRRSMKTFGALLIASVFYSTAYAADLNFYETRDHVKAIGVYLENPELNFIPEDISYKFCRLEINENGEFSKITIEKQSNPEKPGFRRIIDAGYYGSEKYHGVFENQVLTVLADRFGIFHLDGERREMKFEFDSEGEKLIKVSARIINMKRINNGSVSNPNWGLEEKQVVDSISCLLQ